MFKCCYNIFFSIFFSVSETNKVICAPHECFWGWASDLTYIMFSFFYVLTLVNYVIIWIMLRWTAKKNQKQAASFAWAYRILKTLSVLMILNLIGFSMNSIVRLIVPRFELNVTQRTILIHSLSCLTNLVMASNAPILFIFNQDYKRAFQTVFKLKKFSVTSITTAVAITPNDVKKCIPKNNNNNNKILTPIN
uniref:G_PROTEIN_RECEP_F1_2 domain-containing protein n=1 Tax=Meloidogyne hapla TaxID=6305 RepID=A0A1I8B0X3_MELHA